MPGFRNLHADLFAMKAIVSLLAICSFPLVWIAANAWLWRIGKWRALLAAVVFSTAVGVVVWFETLDFRGGILHNVSVLKAKE